MRKMMLFLGGVACVAAAWAQDYQKTAYGVKATVNAVDVEVQFFTPSVVRILKSPHGESFEKKSLSVVASPGEVGFKISVKKGGHCAWHQGTTGKSRHVDWCPFLRNG